MKYMHYVFTRFNIKTNYGCELKDPENPPMLKILDESYLKNAWFVHTSKENAKKVSEGLGLEGETFGKKGRHTIRCRTVCLLLMWGVKEKDMGYMIKSLRSFIRFLIR